MLCFAKFVVAVARQAFSRLRGRKSARSVGRKLFGKLLDREIVDLFEFHILNLIYVREYKFSNPPRIFNTVRPSKSALMVGSWVKSVENPEKFAKFVKINNLKTPIPI